MAAVHQCRVGGRVDGGDRIAHLLEFVGDRGEFGGITVAKRFGEPGGQARARPFDDRFEFAQPWRAGAVTELGGGLQTHHLFGESPCRGCPFGRRQ